MNVVYVDTSAFVKLYIQEAGTDRIRTRLGMADTVASSTLIWPETLATLARRRRESLLDTDEHERVRRQFQIDYSALVTVDLDGRVLELVDDVLCRHPLRSADAVHLASALLLAESGLSVEFVASDRPLLTAARSSRLSVFDPSA